MRNTTQAPKLNPIIWINSNPFRKTDRTGYTELLNHITGKYEPVTYGIYRTLSKGKWEDTSVNKSILIHRNLNN